MDFPVPLDCHTIVWIIRLYGNFVIKINTFSMIIEKFYQT